MSTESPEVRYAVPPTGAVVPHVAGEVPAVGPFAPCGKLTDALALARDRCKAAARDRRNEYHNYAYTSADAILAAAHEALAGSGLALIPQSQRLSVLGQGGHALYTLDRVFILSHVSGEFTRLDVEGWPVIPDKGRPLDKAFAIALTSSLSYLVTGLLQIPRGDGDDMAARKDREPRPAKANGRAPAPPVDTDAPEYVDRVRDFARRAEECETVECLRGVYDDVHADTVLVKADRVKLKEHIRENKTRLTAAAPKPAPPAPATTPAGRPLPTGEPIPF